MIAEHPRLLGVMADLNLIPWVVGGPALEPAAKLLVDFLEGGADRCVVAPHFGGAASPQVLEPPGWVRDLFEQPRLLVIFSRHGAYDPDLVEAGRQRWSKRLAGSAFCLEASSRFASGATKVTRAPSIGRVRWTRIWTPARLAARTLCAPCGSGLFPRRAGSTRLLRLGLGWLTCLPARDWKFRRKFTSVCWRSIWQTAAATRITVRLSPAC